MRQLTMIKLYPNQRLSQLFGHSGTFMSWLWTANTFVSTSHTTHLNSTVFISKNIRIISEGKAMCVFFIERHLTSIINDLSI